jgi:hypothetical protein
MAYGLEPDAGWATPGRQAALLCGERWMASVLEEGGRCSASLRAALQRAYSGQPGRLLAEGPRGSRVKLVVEDLAVTVLYHAAQNPYFHFNREVFRATDSIAEFPYPRG